MHPLERKLFWVFVFHFGTQEGCSAYSTLLSMVMITESLWRFTSHEKHLWLLVSENTVKLYCPVNVDIRSKNLMGKKLFVIQSIPEHLPWANSCRKLLVSQGVVTVWSLSAHRPRTLYLRTGVYVSQWPQPTMLKGQDTPSNVTWHFRLSFNRHHYGNIALQVKFYIVFRTVEEESRWLTAHLPPHICTEIKHNHIISSWINQIPAPTPSVN